MPRVRWLDEWKSVLGLGKLTAQFIGPVVIGNDCYLENCCGPYSSIADQVIMMDTDLEHSVVLQVLKSPEFINASLTVWLGNVLSSPCPPPPKALRFHIGDDCQIVVIYFLTINYYSTQ